MGALDVPTKATSARYFVPGANHSAQIAGLDQTNRNAALAHAARMFGENPDLTALPRAITASQTRDKILARAFARNDVLDTLSQ